jgi:hypothetical protein
MNRKKYGEQAITQQVGHVNWWVIKNRAGTKRPNVSSETRRITHPMISFCEGCLSFTIKCQVQKSWNHGDLFDVKYWLICQSRIIANPSTRVCVFDWNQNKEHKYRLFTPLLKCYRTKRWFVCILSLR